MVKVRLVGKYKELATGNQSLFVQGLFAQSVILRDSLLDLFELLTCLHLQDVNAVPKKPE